MIRETGRVWSGALLTPGDGQMFIGISGRWRVPEVTLPPSAGDTAENKLVCSSSTWIGLDGTRSYLHSSLPQIGTIQNVKLRNGEMHPKYCAFYEWWCAGHVSHPNPIDLPIKPGDLIECTLVVDTLTRVTFSMKNQTTKRDWGPFSTPAPNLPPVDGSPLPPIQRLISGATAEWITERPSDPDTREPYELANYGRVVFEDCVAIAAPDPLNTTRRHQTLADNRVALRDMVQIRQDRARRISTAQLLGPTSVATSYKGG